MAQKARAAWIGFHDAIETELSEGGEFHGVRDVASKAADNVARLAALFHVFEGKTGAIGSSCVEAASRIVAWHLSESRRFYAELALPPELADAVKLDTWLMRHCKRERTHFVRKNHVRQCGPNQVRDGTRLDAAIRELESLDRLRLERNGKLQTLHVNPVLVTGGGEL